MLGKPIQTPKRRPVLIRYKIGDQVEMEKSKCNCKRNFRIVKEIVGKQCDYIETPAGKILGAVMSHSIDNAKGVIVSQCIQDSKNHLVIKLVIDKFYNEISEKKLEADLRKRIGNKMKIDFEMVTQLEKNMGGKTPFIISKIGNKY